MGSAYKGGGDVAPRGDHVGSTVAVRTGTKGPGERRCGEGLIRERERWRVFLPHTDDRRWTEVIGGKERAAVQFSSGRRRLFGDAPATTRCALCGTWSGDAEYVDDGNGAPSTVAETAVEELAASGEKTRIPMRR